MKPAVSALIALAAILLGAIIIYVIQSGSADASCGNEGQPGCSDYCQTNPEASECRSLTGLASCGGAGEPECSFSFR